MKITPSDVCDEISKMNDRESLFAMVCENGPSKWQAIRKIYETIDLARYVPYLVDWTKILTPIESMAWGEIRCSGLPFYPQYPVGRFFADFADPVKKLVIECDGKQYHNAERDDMRDAFMAANGWTVFRVSGADCNRVLADPWEYWAEAEDDSEQALAKAVVEYWAKHTVDGLVWALGCVYYERAFPSLLAGLADSVVNLRVSKSGAA